MSVTDIKGYISVRRSLCMSHAERMLYRVVRKSGHPHFCQQLHQMLTDFHNSFTRLLASKFAIGSILNIPPDLTNVATLPCKILLSENSDIVINDKLQGSVSTHLRCSGYALLQTSRSVCW